MSLHLNLSTGKFLNSSTLFKLSDALLLDVSSGEIVMSNLLVPRAGVDLFKLASLDLNFAQRKSLTDRVSGNNLVTFSRASSGTYVDSDGLIKTSPVNLLYNTTTYSNWINSGQSIQTNAAISPSGLNDAVKLVADASAGGKLSYRSATTTATNVCSVYAKAGEYTNIQLRELSAARFYVNFDLSAGTYAVPQSGSAPAGGFDFISADIQDVGNGWYRCIVVNSRVGGIAFSIAGYPDSATVTTSLPNFTGDGTSGVYIWGAQVEEGSTASTYIPTTTTIGGAPRFDHDPVTGESLGLLIEESRTNLFTYSEQFDIWQKSNISITANQGIAPDGTLTADLVTTNTANTYNTLDQLTTLSTNTNYCYSVFVKLVSGSGTSSRVVFGSSSSGVSPVFASWGLQLDTLTETADGSIPTIKGYISYPNGWYRLYMVINTSSQTNAKVQIRFGTANVDNVATFYIWGAQLEEGSFPTSYIPTDTSTVTRAADVASITGTNFSSWFNPSEGTIYSKAIGSPQTTTTPNTGSGYPYIYSIDSSLSNRLIGSRSAGVNNGSWAAYAQPPASFSYVTSSNFNTQQVSHKVGGSYTSSTYVAFADGVVGSSITPGTNNSALLRLSIGSGIDGGFWGGHISRLAYFPTRKTDQELIDLTT